MDRPFPSRASSSGDFAPDEPSKPYGLPRTMEEHREFLKNYKLRPEDTEVLRNCSERVISDTLLGAAFGFTAMRIFTTFRPIAVPMWSRLAYTTATLAGGYIGQSLARKSCLDLLMKTNTPLAQELRRMAGKGDTEPKGTVVMPDGRTVNVADIDIKPTSDEFAPDDPDPERLLQQQARQASAESGQRSFQDRSRGGRRLSPPLEQTDRDARRDADPHHDDHAAAAPPRLWTDHDRLPHATSPDGWGGPHRDHPPAPDRGQYAEDRGHGGDGQYVTWEEIRRRHH